MARLSTLKGAPEELTLWQQECLMFGQPLLDPEGVTYDEARAWLTTPEARQAWRRHRKALLKDFARTYPDDVCFGAYAYDEDRPPTEYWDWQSRQREAKKQENYGITDKPN